MPANVNLEERMIQQGVFVPAKAKRTTPVKIYRVSSENTDGGPGSGNFGHKGVEGQIGGSAPASNTGKITDTMKSARKPVSVAKPAEQDVRKAFEGSTDATISLMNKYQNEVDKAEAAGDKAKAEEIRTQWKKEHAENLEGRLKSLGTYMEDGYYIPERDLDDESAEIFQRDKVNVQSGCFDMKPVRSTGSRDNVPATGLSNRYVKLSEEEVKSRLASQAEKTGYDQTLGGISSSDERCISTYTYATPANAALRRGETNEQAEQLKKILDRTVSPQRTVYRGVTGEFADKLSRLKEGETVTDKGFMSTSYDKDVAKSFAGDNGVTLQIDVPSGYGHSLSVGSYSLKPEEYEVLLNAGCTLKVVEKNGKEIKCVASFDDTRSDGKDTKQGVGVLVIKDGKFLTGYRNGLYGNGQLGGPGGHVEEGESLATAALRETDEEFGIIPMNLIPLGYGEIDELGIRPFTFLCTEYIGEIHSTDNEMSDLAFRTPEEVEDADKFRPFENSISLLMQEINKSSEKLSGTIDNSDGISYNKVTDNNKDGGKGSGNFGHKGVKGQVGGSAPADETSENEQEKGNDKSAEKGEEPVNPTIEITPAKNSQKSVNEESYKKQNSKGSSSENEKSENDKPKTLDGIHGFTKFERVGNVLKVANDTIISKGKKGSTLTLVAGDLVDVFVFAGKGSNEPLKLADEMAKTYHNSPSDWSKSSGFGYVRNEKGEEFPAEVHWFSTEELGQTGWKWKPEGSKKKIAKLTKQGGGSNGNTKGKVS